MEGRVAALGIIGGSGIYRLADLRDKEAVSVGTPFGAPSGSITRGAIGKTEVLFLARHGAGHIYSPSNVPYRANICALKQLGATHVLSLSAVGSLRDELPPRTLVLPDQIIDRTLGRERTFFDYGVVAHVGLADPFCGVLQEAIAAAAEAAGHLLWPSGAYVCIEGPQFSTRAESQLYRTWGASVIGMTAMPEARLAREAELCYATLALVTDYDVWHETEEDVSVSVVLAHLQANIAAASRIVQQLAMTGLPERSCGCGAALSHAIVTSPDQISSDALQRLAPIAGGRLPST
jgi:5'-methylthioadenosine phosphorylase